MKYAGFTLIELIIVISIIALLAALLLPALDAARQHAETVVCASNLRQLVMALSTYDQNNDTFPPGFDDITYGTSMPPGGYVGEASYDLQGWWWFHFLDDLSESASVAVNVLKCPSRNIEDIGLKENLLCGNYGVNRSVCKNAVGSLPNEFVGTSLSSDDMRQPARTLLIVDSGYSLVSWYATLNGVANIFENPMRIGNFYVPGLSINDNRTFTNRYEQDAIDGRHPGKRINAGSVDGHVDRIKSDILTVEGIGGDYTNLSPLWLPK